MSYYFRPIWLAKIKKCDATQCWQRMWGDENSWPQGKRRDYKLAYLFQKAKYLYLHEIKIHHLTLYNAPHLGMCHRGNLKSTLFIVTELVAAQVSLIGEILKLNVVFVYYGIISLRNIQRPQQVLSKKKRLIARYHSEN